jgi:hypothetical protein
VKTRFALKCNLYRYAMGPALKKLLQFLHQTIAALADGVGRCSLTPPDPYLKGRLVPRWFQPLHLSRENPVSKRAFQTQLAPLRRGAARRRAAAVPRSRAVQAESS